VPHDLRVVVAMVVDEARRDGPAVGFDGLARGAAETPHLDDLDPRHVDVAGVRGPTRSVDDASILDEQVVGHAWTPLLATATALPSHHGAPGPTSMEGRVPQKCPDSP